MTSTYGKCDKKGLLAGVDDSGPIVSCLSHSAGRLASRDRPDSYQRQVSSLACGLLASIAQFRIGDGRRTGDISRPFGLII